jgi:transposase
MYKLLYDGLSQRAIAAALGKSSPTVQNLIRKTRLESQRIIPRNDLC